METSSRPLIRPQTYVRPRELGFCLLFQVVVWCWGVKVRWKHQTNTSARSPSFPLSTHPNTRLERRRVTSFLTRFCVGIMSKFALYDSLLENPTLELYTVYVRSKCCTTEAFGEIATKQRYSFWSSKVPVLLFVLLLLLFPPFQLFGCHVWSIHFFFCKVRWREQFEHTTF